MRKFRLLRTNFSRLSASKLAAKAAIINQAIHSAAFVAAFPVITPDGEEIQSALSDYNNALAAETSKSVVEVRKMKRNILEDLLNLLALELERLANGDLSKLALTGYDLKKSVGVQTEGNTPTPQNLRLFHYLSGQIRGKVDALGPRMVFIGAHSYDPINGPWITHPPTTNSQKILFTGLERGRDVYTKVQAVGSHGPSDWSDIAVIMVV